jgi:Fe-S cluster assembly protein SufD
MSEAAAYLLDSFDARIATDEPAWLSGLRREAIDRFQETGLPSRRDEDFKHTPVESIFSRKPGLAPAAKEPAAPLADLPRLAENELRVVFTDGRLDRKASTLADLPAGLSMQSLQETWAEDGAAVPEWISGISPTGSRSLTALNTAFMEDGALVTLDADTAPERLVHLVFVTTEAASGRAIHLRNRIRAEGGSRLRVIEHYLGRAAEAVVNVVTEIEVGENATVHHGKFQEEGPATDHLSSVEVTVGAGGHFTHHSFACGAGTGRTEMRVTLAGRGAECDLSGVYLGRDRQLADQLTLVDHAVPGCRSSQVYRGVLDGHARGVFNGLVIVRPDAQQTVAEQQNRNLLLSETAQAHTRPQLLIDADDVSCSHGATVGSLDPDSMFYLRSRGIGPDEARLLLVRAFAADVLAAILEDGIREFAEGLLDGWLSA